MMVLHVDNDKDDDNSYKVLKLLKREGGGGRERGEREMPKISKSIDFHNNGIRIEPC